MSETKRRRVLVVAPSGRDGVLARQLITNAGMQVDVCASVAAMCEESKRGAGVCVIAEEAFDGEGIEGLADLLASQPAWSDIPFLVINTRLPSRRHPLLDALLENANVTFLERPLRGVSFLSALNSGLRARDRQYTSERAIVQRDAFLAMLSHELRNPLAAVVLSVEVLRQPGTDAFLAGEQLERISRQSSHLTKLVDDLLDMSRITSGRIVLKQEGLDLVALINAAVKSLATSDDMERVEVEVSAPRLPVQGDRTRLEQIFANLLINALKYTPPPGKIHLLVDAVDGEARVTVRDEGIGIAPEMLPRIFEMFVQADGALARSQGGMGIGLTLAKNLVDLHGGRIEAASDGIGRGSVFTVRLPLAQSLAFPTGVEADSAPTWLSRRIVIIEDSDDLRETMRILLNRAGHVTAVARDGIQGLDLLLSTRPQMAFIDIGLPGLDGYAVARAARAQLGSTVTLVAVSGYGRSDDKRRAFEAGFDTHLTKPIDSRLLLRTAAA